MNFWTSTVSESYYRFIEDLEGRFNEVYLDSGGEPTIGIGHLLTVSERRSGKIQIGAEVVRYARGLTDQQVDRLLRHDTKKAIRVVNKNVRVPLTPGQFNAMTSFIYNVGEAAFVDSTLLRLLNKGNHDQVPFQMRRWKYDNGRIVQGLINRREKEIRMWESQGLRP